MSCVFLLQFCQKNGQFATKNIKKLDICTSVKYNFLMRYKSITNKRKFEKEI